MYVQWLLLKRIFAGHSPLRFTALMTATNIAMGLGVFYYMTVVVGASSGVRAEAYHLYGGVAAFMAVGVAMNALLTVGLNAVAKAISDERNQGTLSYWVICQPRLLKLVLQASLGEFLLAAVNAIITFALLVGVFGVRFHINVVSLLAVGAISVLAVIGVGLAAASLNISGGLGQNPILWAWGLTTNFLAGVFVPIEVFDNQLIHGLSRLVPVTHALLAMRSAVLRNAPLGDPLLDADLLYWGVFALLMLPLGAWLFQRGLDRALVRGHLIQS
ncbi:MAG TPA: ABC transporter permease [Candidatus Dormibacteraeota bacterium]